MELVPEEYHIEIPSKYQDYLTHLNYLENYPIGLESSI